MAQPVRGQRPYALPEPVSFVRAQQIVKGRHRCAQWGFVSGAPRIRIAWLVPAGPTVHVDDDCCYAHGRLTA